MKVKQLLFLIIPLLFFIQCSSEPILVQLEFANDSQIERLSENVEISIDQISKLNLILLSRLQIVDDLTKNEIIYQLVDSNDDEKIDKIIFQTNFKSGETKSFTFKDGGVEKDFSDKSKVYAKFVPERMDDFAWENDRIAFRMYGPALEATGEISNGIDVWVKRTRDLILDKWYKGEDYHKDHGEGLDYYKVGPSLGAGGSALWEDGKINKSKNFVKWNIMENGPIRTTFELTYAPRKYNGSDIREVKIISLDAGKNLNKIDVKYITDVNSITYQSVIGIVKHPGEDNGKTYINKEKGIFGYWEPTNKDHGNTAVGVLVNTNKIEKIMETEDHYLILLKETKENTFSYYTGAAWSGSGDFADSSAWMNYLNIFYTDIHTPLM